MLRGRIWRKEPSRTIVDVGGVGYVVHIPLSTFLVLGEPGTEVELHIHTHVREDALQLYGFRSAAELKLFERLLAVRGIGPKLASTTLSGMEVQELVQAIAGGDATRLTAIPGLGMKSAERIILELRGKLADLGTGSAGGKGAAAPASVDIEDAVSALTNLGYSKRDAELAVKAAAREQSGIENILRAALARLVR